MRPEYTVVLVGTAPCTTVFLVMRLPAASNCAVVAAMEHAVVGGDWAGRAVKAAPLMVPMRKSGRSAAAVAADKDVVVRSGAGCWCNIPQLDLGCCWR